MDASLRAFVVQRAAGHCEYCRLPQRFFTELFQQNTEGEMLGRTPIGRTTLYVLNMNDPRRVELRKAIAALLRPS